MILTLRWKHDLFGLLIGQNSHDNACAIQHEYRQVIWEQTLQCGSEVKQVLRFLENMLGDPFLYLPLQNVIFVWTVLKAFEQVDCVSDFQLKKTEGHYESHLLDVFANTWYTNLVEISCFHIPTSPNTPPLPTSYLEILPTAEGQMQMQGQQQGFIQGKGNFPCHTTNLGCSPQKKPNKNTPPPKKIEANSWGLYIFGVFLILMTGLKWGIGACQSRVTKMICFHIYIYNVNVF